MAVRKLPTVPTAPAADDRRPLADHAHSILVQAANGARRVALQEERIESLIRAGQESMIASAREQLHLMNQAQQIRMQLLSAAQREIIDAAVRTGRDLTDLVVKRNPPDGAGAA
jgi:hypothetical protein